MFGFLRLGCSGDLSRQYRQVYAALCAFQRANYGHCSAVFNSYEAVFLYQVCIEAGACQPPSPSTPTCCRFHSDPSNRWQLDHDIARFCTAFAMVLAATKLEDDIRDHQSILAKLTAKVLRNQFAHARKELDHFQPGLTDRIKESIAEHLQFEQAQTPCSLNEYVQPTAKTFADVFSALERYLRTRLSQAPPCRNAIDPQSPIPASDRHGHTCLGQLSAPPDITSLPDMCRLGYAIGAAIIAADCANDYQRDRRTGEYNPLNGETERRRAYEFSLHELAYAGWSCMDANRIIGKRGRSIATSILKSAFHRLDSRSSTTAFDMRRRAMARRGECDCAGEVCCNWGCESVGCCCDADDGNAISCCGDAANVCANDGWAGCELCICDPCCDWHSRSKEEQRTGSNEADRVTAESDATHDQQRPQPTVRLGMSVGEIAPYGIVRIGNSILPARSATPIRPEQPVIITEANWFGVDVRPADPVSVSPS